MEAISYRYKNASFGEIMQATFRKYLDKTYEGKNIVIDICRNIENDKLITYRVQKISYMVKNIFIVEKIEIDRKIKVYKSKLQSFFVDEECTIKPLGPDVIYEQLFKIYFMFVNHKKNIFFKGCEIVENIMQNQRQGINI